MLEYNHFYDFILDSLATDSIWWLIHPVDVLHLKPHILQASLPCAILVSWCSDLKCRVSSLADVHTLFHVLQVKSGWWLFWRWHVRQIKVAFERHIHPHSGQMRVPSVPSPERKFILFIWWVAHFSSAYPILDFSKFLISVVSCVFKVHFSNTRSSQTLMSMLTSVNILETVIFVFVQLTLQTFWLEPFHHSVLIFEISCHLCIVSEKPILGLKFLLVAIQWHQVFLISISDARTFWWKSSRYCT